MTRSSRQRLSVPAAFPVTGGEASATRGTKNRRIQSEFTAPGVAVDQSQRDCGPSVTPWAAQVDRRWGDRNHGSQSGTVSD